MCKFIDWIWQMKFCTQTLRNLFVVNYWKEKGYSLKDSLGLLHFCFINIRIIFIKLLSD